MYRLWLWPLGLAPIFIWAWLKTKYQIHEATLIVPAVILWTVFAIEQSRSGAKKQADEKAIKSVPATKILDLSRGPQIMLGICAALMAGMIFSQGNWSDPVALFCTVVAGACLLPEGVRFYFVDVIAISAIIFCVWALIQILEGSITNNPAVPIVVGFIGGLHLFHRYKLFIVRHFISQPKTDMEHADELSVEKADVKISVLLRLRYLIVVIFSALSFLYFATIDSIFDRGFFLAVKILSIPLAVLCLLFIKSHQEQLKQIYNFSGFKIWLYGMFLVYPAIVIMSWPYFLAANAVTGDDSIVMIGGVIEEKYVDVNRRGHTSYIVKGQVSGTENKFSFAVHERNYDLLKEGDTIYRTFFSGGFGIPWRRADQPPQPDQIIPASQFIGTIK